MTERFNGISKHEFERGSFKYSGRIVLSPSKPIYGVKWCHVSPQFERYFAVICGSKAAIFNSSRMERENSIEPCQVYAEDDDGNGETDEFYSLAWTSENQMPLLTVGSKYGQIKIISITNMHLQALLIGHVDAVNDLKYHPKEPSILLSASKDESIRMWNVRTKVCIAIFSGLHGHRDEILSIDVRSQGDLFVTGSIDNSCKIWSLKNDEIDWAIKESNSEELPHGSQQYRTRIVQYPLFSSSKIHCGYVDCVKFIGNLILSKAPEDIVLWRPSVPSGEAIVLNHYEDSLNSSVWFMRFATDSNCKTVAVGGQNGTILMWSIDKRKSKATTLSHENCKTHIRMLDFSHDGKELLACCEDSSVWKWSYQQSKQ